VHIAFYRITQEALNNVVKHARAHQATVRLCYSGEDQVITSQKARQPEDVRAGQTVRLSIRDDGRGFDPTQVPHNRLGLGIMQERAQAIGGILTIESQPGHGTQVTTLWEQAGKEEAK
jgi:signal transduction histidine kinase